MGAAARISQRRVVAAASDAVAKTNDLVGRYNDCVRVLNEQQERLESIEGDRRVAQTEITGRLDAHGKWIDTVERNAVDASAGVEDGKRALVHLSSTIISRTPASNTFFGRLRWLFTGF